MYIPAIEKMEECFMTSHGEDGRRRDGKWELEKLKELENSNDTA